MSDGSDFDDDIDKLLDEIDSVSTGKKASGAKPFTASSSTSSKAVKGDEAKAENGNGGSKVTLKSDGNGIKVNYGGGGFKLSDLSKPGGGPEKKDPAKAVHFPENPITSASAPAARTQPQNNFLSSLLGNEKTPDAGEGRDSPPVPTSTASRNKQTLSAPSKGDWLGLTDGETSNPSPQMSRRFPRQGPGSAGADESTINFGDDDDEELLRAMGLDSGRKPKNPERAPTARPRESTAAAASIKAKPASGFGLDDDFWPGPFKAGASSEPPTAAPSSRADINDTKPESSVRNTLLQRAALARERPESPLETVPKFQPSLASTPQQPTRSIVDVLPFLNKPKPQADTPDSLEPTSIPAEPSRASSAAPLRSASPAMQGAPSAGPPAKGKVKRSQIQQLPPPAIIVDQNRHTLQLPSHLVDEDELKSMCNSLKSLYTNQLDMQERSYQDQMDCLTQSHARKEDLLREEIKVLHKEYDTRLARLKNELLESEAKIPQRLQNELSAMANFTHQLQTQSLSKSAAPVETESPRSVHASSSNMLPDFDKLLEEKLSSFVESVRASIPPSSFGQQTGNESTRKQLQELSARLEDMTKKFEAFAKYKVEVEAQKNGQLVEAEKKLQEEMARLNKQQKKMKESVVKAAMMTITQTLEFHHEENNHKKDKISGQLKEFRKDVRRILFDLEAKNEVVQKSHISIEADQKEMMQALRELHTLVKVNSVQSKMVDYHHVVPFQSNPMHQQHVQQAEMEIKLLRDERNSLSDSIAQMNVERRKLNEEKLNVEREKMDLEREKNRLRDLEMQLKIRTAEAEDMKKQAEEIRKAESSKALDITLRTAEVDKERAHLKDQFQLNENRLRMREQKLIQEKTELMREKEFLEKLRDQLLCPGCMKSVHQVGLYSRSEGDGLDGSTTSAAGDLSTKLQSLSAILPREDQRYFEKESLYLDDLYFQQFNLTR